MAWHITFLTQGEAPPPNPIYRRLWPHWNITPFWLLGNRRSSSLPLASLGQFLYSFSRIKERKTATDRSFFIDLTRFSHTYSVLDFVLDLHTIIRIKSWSKGVKIPSRNWSIDNDNIPQLWRTSSGETTKKKKERWKD